MKRHCSDHHVLELPTPEALNNEQVDADWRSYLAHLNEYHQNYSKPDRVNAIVRQHRKDKRNRNDDHSETLDERSERRIQNKENGKELHFRQLQADHLGRHPFPNTSKADCVRKDKRCKDEKHDVADKERGAP